MNSRFSSRICMALRLAALKIPAPWSLCSGDLAGGTCPPPLFE